MRKAAQIIVFLLLADVAHAAPGFYWIGNSLTADTIVTSIPGGSGNQWHIDCGIGLKAIYDDPVDPCVGTSTIWTTALAARDFEFLIMQPHGVTETMAENVTVMSEWIDDEPNAIIIIHTSWPEAVNAGTEFDDATTSTVRKSEAFMNALLANLQQAYPTREFRLTNTHAIVHDIWVDIQNVVGPFEDITDLYRDEIHFNTGPGQYLAHNAMRRAIGLGYAEPPDNTATAAEKAYLREKIEAYFGSVKTDGAFQ